MTVKYRSADVAERTRATLSGEWYRTLCPAHPDTHPSCQFKDGDREIVFYCFAGCTHAAIKAAMAKKLNVREDAFVFGPAKGHPRQQFDPDVVLPITVSRLAALKGLPAAWLREHWYLEDLQPFAGVKIPYFLMDGSLAPRWRKRMRPRATDDGSCTWQPPKSMKKPTLYGLHRLAEARTAGYLVIVEGESDTWTGWFHDIPTLGFPGARTTAYLAAEHVAGIPRLFIVQEPGSGGEGLVCDLASHLPAIGYAGAAFVIVMPDGLKDLNDLHRDDPTRFSERLKAAKRKARPLAAVAAAIRAEQLRRTAGDRTPLRADEGDLLVARTAAWEAIVKANTPPVIFTVGRQVVRMAPPAEGGVVVPIDITAERLRSRMAEVAWYYTESADEHGDLVKTPAYPPLPLMVEMLAMIDAPVPSLTRVVEMPVFTADGRLLATPGYDPASGVYYAPPPGFVLPPVPESPTDAEIAVGRERLFDLVATFPFADLHADRAAALAMAIGPMLRELIDAPMPLVMIDKPKPRTGATLLTKGMLRIPVGRAVGSTVLPKREEEIEKTLLAILVKGPSVVFFDDVTRLDSPALSSFLTQVMFQGRVLGATRHIDVPVRCQCVATGNNPTVATDLVGRVMPCRLDAGMEHPETRSFAEADDAWLARIDRERPMLLAALATFVQAWLVRGRPAGTGRTLAGYAAWSRTVDGVFAVAGIEGFLGNLATFRARADAAHAGERELVVRWFALYPRARVTTAQIYSGMWGAGAHGQSPPEVDVEAKTDEDRRKRLGRIIRRLEDQWFELPEPVTLATGTGTVTRVCVARARDLRSGVSRPAETREGVALWCLKTNLDEAEASPA